MKFLWLSKEYFIVFNSDLLILVIYDLYISEDFDPSLLYEVEILGLIILPYY
jgi:hypothetical protein